MTVKAAIATLACGAIGCHGAPSSAPAAVVTPSASVVAIALPPTTIAPPVAHFEGPMPIAFGDCAGPKTHWVVGPRPLAFTPAQADGNWLVPELQPPPAPVITDDGTYANLTFHAGGLYAMPDDPDHVIDANARLTVRIGTSTDPADEPQRTMLPIARRYVRRAQREITTCYREVLATTPAVDGTLDVKLTITAAGSASAVSALGLGEPLAACVRDVIASIEFPKPVGGADVPIELPIELHTTDKPAALAASVFRRAQTGLASDGMYTPGTRDPLRPQVAALAECMRGNAEHAGAIVVELAYDANGSVTAADAHGVTDDRVRACIVAVAKRIAMATVESPSAARSRSASARRASCRASASTVRRRSATARSRSGSRCGAGRPTSVATCCRWPSRSCCASPMRRR